jgi:hypothetical protein
MALTHIRINESIDITPNIPIDVNNIIDYTTAYVTINEQIDDTYYIYITPNIHINIIEYIEPDLSIDDTYYIYITPNILINNYIDFITFNIPINNYINIATDIPINNIY